MKNNYSVISIDCGVKNLSISIIEYTPDKKISRIIYSNCHDFSQGKKVKSITIENTIKYLCKELDKIFEEENLKKELETIKYVIIENQPKVNPRMKIIQTSLMTYFTLRFKIDNKFKVTIKFIPSKYKLYNSGIVKKDEYETVMKGTKGPRGYTKRKKASIYFAKCLLKPYKETYDYVFGTKKQDDLCDSILQSYNFVKFLL